MEYNEFLHFREKPCKIRLKSGKEVYGVMWEKKLDGNKNIYFTSHILHERYRRSIEEDDYSFYQKYANLLTLEEILKVEPLKDTLLLNPAHIH